MAEEAEEGWKWYHRALHRKKLGYDTKILLQFVGLGVGTYGVSASPAISGLTGQIWWLGEA